MSKAKTIRAGKIRTAALIASLCIVVGGTVLTVGQERHPQIADQAPGSATDHMVVIAKRMAADDLVGEIVVTAKRQQYAQIASGSARSAR